ncbi:MAG: hypothetical protein BAJALOKI1v1_70004 [Promethearchaeota archaeon]|nr:MAG: hypothetical protein BAJALOKI1v1_70004 [Candidatus Lokiarchaeota archaeon]
MPKMRFFDSLFIIIMNYGFHAHSLVMYSYLMIKENVKLVKLYGQIIRIFIYF